MNKKGKNNVVKIDDAEDLEIKKIANKSENDSAKLLLIVLILLFFTTLLISIKYIYQYKKNKEDNINLEIIDIKTIDTSASIINNGNISETINTETFDEKDEFIIEKINSIKIMPNKDNLKESEIRFNIKYDILKNDFKINSIASNNSEVLVKFSYSFDQENWTYINNVITTDSSNMSPLIGNTYDIAGLITNLSVATNYKLTFKNKENEIMYWRSETIFKNMNNNAEKNYEANFYIEYKSSL